MDLNARSEMTMNYAIFQRMSSQSWSLTTTWRVICVMFVAFGLLTGRCHSFPARPLTGEEAPSEVIATNNVDNPSTSDKSNLAPEKDPVNPPTLQEKPHIDKDPSPNVMDKQSASAGETIAPENKCYMGSIMNYYEKKYALQSTDNKVPRDVEYNVTACIDSARLSQEILLSKLCRVLFTLSEQLCQLKKEPDESQYSKDVKVCQTKVDIPMQIAKQKEDVEFIEAFLNVPTYPCQLLCGKYPYLCQYFLWGSMYLADQSSPPVDPNSNKLTETEPASDSKTAPAAKQPSNTVVKAIQTNNAGSPPATTPAIPLPKSEKPTEKSKDADETAGSNSEVKPPSIFAEPNFLNGNSAKSDSESKGTNQLAEGDSHPSAVETAEKQQPDSQTQDNQKKPSPDSGNSEKSLIPDVVAEKPNPKPPQSNVEKSETIVQEKGNSAEEAKPDGTTKDAKQDPLPQRETDHGINKEKASNDNVKEQDQETESTGVKPASVDSNPPPPSAKEEDSKTKPQENPPAKKPEEKQDKEKPADAGSNNEVPSSSPKASVELDDGNLTPPQDDDQMDDSIITDQRFVNQDGDLPAPTSAVKDSEMKDNSAGLPDSVSMDQNAVLPRLDGMKYEEDESHFFAYFLTVVTLCIVGYVAFHNKQKIIALVVEGRSQRRRRSNGGNYRRLDNNLADVMEGIKGGSSPHIIY